MAVTLTIDQLAAYIRISDDTEERALAQRLLTVATAMVVKYAPNAPDDIHNQAAAQVVGDMYDRPLSARGGDMSVSLRDSGALAMLTPYRDVAASVIGESETQSASPGSVGNPVTDVDYSGNTLTVTYADGAQETFTIEGGGGSGIDQTARDAASAAQAAADTKLTETEVDARVVAGVESWAHEGDTSLIPTDKFTTPRYIYIQTSAPTGSTFPVGALWIQDIVGQPLKLHEWNGSQWLLDFTFPATLTTTDVNNAIQSWARAGNTDRIPSDKLPENIGGGGALTYTELSSTALSSGSYTLSAAHATAVANELIDGTNSYRALIVAFEDFARHQNNWRIPLGLENYAEGVMHEFYHAYVNNSTGAVHGVNLAIRRNTGAQATAGLTVLASGTIDAGTNMRILGES